jgi:hypothetical protein
VTAVEPGDGDRRRLAEAAGLSERGGELRAALERIRALAAFDLDELGRDLEAPGRGEPGDGFALRFDPQAGSALLLRTDPQIGDKRFQLICHNDFVFS